MTRIMITYRPKENRNKSETIITDNLSKIMSIVKDIGNTDSEAERAFRWCSQAKESDKVLRRENNYKLECIGDKYITDSCEISNSVANIVGKELGLAFKFNGLDSRYCFNYEFYNSKSTLSYSLETKIFKFVAISNDNESALDIEDKNKEEFIKRIVRGVPNFEKEVKYKAAKMKPENKNGYSDQQVIKIMKAHLNKYRSAFDNWSEVIYNDGTWQIAIELSNMGVGWYVTRETQKEKSILRLRPYRYDKNDVVQLEVIDCIGKRCVIRGDIKLKIKHIYKLMEEDPNGDFLMVL